MDNGKVAVRFPQDGTDFVPATADGLPGRLGAILAAAQPPRSNVTRLMMRLTAARLVYKAVRLAAEGDASEFPNVREGGLQG